MDVIGQVYDRLLGGSVIVLAVLIILSIGGIARLEVDNEAFARLLDMRADVVRQLKGHTGG